MPTQLKYCSTCHIFRPPRTVHCSLCNHCLTADHIVATRKGWISIRDMNINSEVLSLNVKDKYNVYSEWKKVTGLIKLPRNK